MNTPLDRDAKSCLERWKNYLKPGIKKGSLSEEEQCLVIRLQVKHGNKWKKIAAEVPGRTAKRLEDNKYNQILETFAEKLVKERPPRSVFMATSNGGLFHSASSAPPQNSLPTWFSNTSAPCNVRPASPSVTLILSPSTTPLPSTISWLQPEREHENIPIMELEEGHRAWAAHKKEAAWRLKYGYGKWVHGNQSLVYSLTYSKKKQLCVFLRTGFV
ncbi:hypothetical protein POM88_035883 [Heracleum sosnowskyi]|uniref:MYB transcription factor n=1 Tax=Heracleum sosnowskyi TaxID=360622 RepID=A0AAD8HN93_9APIA|nr:hypothetical protein POM88_035883 [Heracleum sosnowskyi]